MFDSDVQQTDFEFKAVVQTGTRYVVVVTPKNAAGRGDVARTFFTTAGQRAQQNGDHLALTVNPVSPDTVHGWSG